MNSHDLIPMSVAMTALCVMEHIEGHAVNSPNPIVERYRSSLGTGELRELVVRSIAPRIDAAYDRAVEYTSLDNILCFDLDFVPTVFELITLSNESLDIAQELWDSAAIKIIWLSHFSELLRSTYGITTHDLGDDGDIIFERYGEGGKRQPLEAVKEIGLKRDLDPTW